MKSSTFLCSKRVLACDSHGASRLWQKHRNLRKLEHKSRRKNREHVMLCGDKTRSNYRRGVVAARETFDRVVAGSNPLEFTVFFVFFFKTFFSLLSNV